MNEKNTVRVNVWDLENTSAKREDHVICEELLTIQIDNVGSFTFLCTPSDIEELALGFAFTEGLIDTRNDVISISKSTNNGTFISLAIRNPERVKTKRNLIVTSGCGVCGKHNIENIISSISPLTSNLKFNAKRAELLEKDIKNKQTLFLATGAAHAAALFDQDEQVISMCEDVGRHNALDKAIGFCVKNDIATARLGLFLSSRISFEMVTKAARAGVELIIGVSAPTSLAIKAANFWNITLCGFVRSGQGNIYTAKERIY